MNNLKNENINIDTVNVKQIKDAEKIQNIDLIKEIETVINQQLKQVQDSYYSVTGINK